MRLDSGNGRRLAAAMGFLATLIATHASFAGVSRPIQDRYRRSYESKALFLRLPVFAERKLILISGRSYRPEPEAAGTARFKVGDQVRITGIDFGGDEIRFRISAITGAGLAEIVYKFDAPLADDFPNSEVFDRALQATFTEGLQYTDIEDAKRSYVEDAFERYVRETAALTSSSREAVLKGMAARLPAYQDALKDLENLKGKIQDLSGQLTQRESESRKLEADLKAQQSEVARLRTANSALQEKIDASSSQLLRLGEEVRSARGATQGYQRELSNLQQSLNLKVDASRDIGSQIGDLAQAVRRIQRESAALASQNSALSSNLAAVQAANARLTRQVEELDAANRQKSETIASLTSKEDSLARQYLQLKQVKEKLEAVVRSSAILSTRVRQEEAAGGFRTGKVEVLLKDLLVGTLEYALPETLSHSEEARADVSFTAESIDYVRVSPEERQILRSLGDKLKVQVQLGASVPTLNVKAEGEHLPREVGERERVAWSWRVLNAGAADGCLTLDVHLVNRNADRIPLLHREEPVRSANIVRQVRQSLQPIPLIVGALIGFVLFGIVGLFRRFAASAGSHRRRSPEPADHNGPKRL